MALAAVETIPVEVQEQVRELTDAVDRAHGGWASIDPHYVEILLRATLSAQIALMEPDAPESRDRLRMALDGLVADSAVTLGVGELEPEAQRLLDVCQEALGAGIEQARVENRLSDISHAIQVVVEEAGFSVVRSLVGHGVGRSYHEDPQIPNYGPPGRGPLLQEGMTLAIEPMITAGAPDVYVHADDWSISSVDDSLAAHFEHTVAITAEGPRILTTAGAALLR